MVLGIYSLTHVFIFLVEIVASAGDLTSLAKLRRFCSIKQEERSEWEPNSACWHRELSLPCSNKYLTYDVNTSAKMPIEEKQHSYQETKQDQCQAFHFPSVSIPQRLSHFWLTISRSNPWERDRNMLPLLGAQSFEKIGRYEPGWLHASHATQWRNL